MKKLIIFGNSDFAELVTHYLQEQYEIVAYTVDNRYVKSDTFLSKPVVPFENIAEIYSPKKYNLFVAIGYHKRNSIRAEKIEIAQKLGYNLVNYIHPSAVLDRTAKIGKNCMLLENSVLQPFSTLKDGCIVFANATLCHHSIVEKNSFICSNSCINGYSLIKKNTFIGAGAIIRDKITIEENNLIGAGCMIQTNTDKNAVYKNESITRLT